MSETIVELPGGLVLDGGRRLSRAELRSLTGHEEEWLARHPGIPSARAVTHLLSACLVELEGEPPGRETVRQLLVGDRDYLMLQLRRITLGDHFHAVVTCPACQARMDADFETEDIPVERRPQTTAGYTIELTGQEDRCRSVRFRLPNGGDQEAVLGMDLDRATMALLERCLEDDGGMPLSPDEQATVGDAMERLAPQIDLELELACPECGHTFSGPFDPATFFFDEMRTSAALLLREIHYLAFYYHWSETEILRLSRDRRRAYLALLSETLHQE